MKPNNSGKQSAYVAAALGAILLVSGCARPPDPMFSKLPSNLDGGIGQLVRYCTKFKDSGDYVTAAGICERAHQLDPSNPAPLMHLGEILVAMKRPEQAISAYRAITEAMPSHTESRYALGKLYINLGQYDLAAAEFEAALAHKVDDPRIYNALGVAHGLNGANDAALQAFDSGIKVAPKDVPLRNNLGLSLVLNGFYDDGIKVLEDVAADPNANATSHENLQLAYGMFSDAQASQAPAQTDPAVNGATTGFDLPNMEMKDDPDMDGQSAVSGPQESRLDGQTAPFIPLIQSPVQEQEAAVKTTGETETPIEVAVIDSSSTGQDTKAEAETSPLSRQMASAASNVTADSGTPSTEPSATLGNYVAADANIGDTATKTPSDQTDSTDLAVAAGPDAVSAEGQMAGDPIYAVQLASYRSEGYAEAGWGELRTAAPDLLDAVGHTIVSANLGEDAGTFYRLRTAPISKSEANSLCSALKSRGIDCLVVKDQPAAATGDSQSG